MGATFRLKLSIYLQVDMYIVLFTTNFISITVSYFCMFINTMQFYNNLADIFDKIKLTGYSLINNDVTHTMQFRIARRLVKCELQRMFQGKVFFCHQVLSQYFLARHD